MLYCGLRQRTNQINRGKIILDFSKLICLTNPMKIKVANPKVSKTKTYPYLGVFNYPGDMTVLFTAPLCGIRITPGNPPYKVGEYLENWAEDEFTPCPKGTVVTFEQE